jgi:hypothetical protein
LLFQSAYVLRMKKPGWIRSEIRWFNGRMRYIRRTWLILYQDLCKESGSPQQGRAYMNVPCTYLWQYCRIPGISDEVMQ